VSHDFVKLFCQKNGTLFIGCWVGSEFDKKMGHPTPLGWLIRKACPALLPNFLIVSLQRWGVFVQGGCFLVESAIFQVLPSGGACLGCVMHFCNFCDFASVSGEVAIFAKFGIPKLSLILGCQKIPREAVIYN